MFDVTFVLYEKDGLARDEALRYWREQHGPLLRDVPGVRSYVQQHAIGAPQGEPPFLGVATLRFDDQAAFDAAAGSAEFAAAVADVENFASTRIDTAIVEQVVIIE